MNEEHPTGNVEIRKASIDDAAQLAQLFRKSFNAALPHIPLLHSPEEDLDFFSKNVLLNNEVYAATQNSKIIGFIAFDLGWVNHLYLSPDVLNRGVGSKLLEIAKGQRESLLLWTFQKNERAISFYKKHGFTIIKVTDGSGNEEKEPDYLFEWLTSK